MIIGELRCETVKRNLTCIVTFAFTIIINKDFFLGDDNIVLHKFPNPEKDPTRFYAWLQAVGGNLLCLDNMYVFKYRRICHKHFEVKYYTRSKMLSNNAIPTLHMSG